jgi:hypothetical protein
VLFNFDSVAVGEDVLTTSVPDAQHWSDFYRELASFDQTVRRLKRQVASLSGDSRGAAARLALPSLIADCEAFQHRFDFWQGRISQLSLR